MSKVLSRHLALTILLIGVLFISVASSVSAQSFIRGDVDTNGTVDITDPILALDAMFLGQFQIPCEKSADVDDSGVLDITDPIVNLGYQFLGNFVPPAPGPESCGTDPTADALTCLSFPSCASTSFVTISSPENFFATKEDKITVTGSSSADILEVQVNGISAVVDDGSYSVEVSLREGPNKLQAVGVNQELKQVASSVIVVKDSTAPAIVITSPTQRSEVFTNRVTVTGMINDPNVIGLKVEKPLVEINGQAADVNSGAFSLADFELTAGVNTLRAVVRDALGNENEDTIAVIFREDAVKKIVVQSGDSQSVAINQQLAEPLVALVTDEAGLPVAGADVIFKVTQSDGTFTDGKRLALVNSNAQGLASIDFIAGTRAGQGCNRVEAFADGFQGRAIFTINTQAGVPFKINPSSGELQYGVINSVAPLALAARVTDEGNNPLSGVVVRFQVIQGGGRLNENDSGTYDVETDDTGRVSATMVLGPEPGIENNVVTAMIQGAGDPAPRAVKFTASAYQGGDPANTRLSGSILDHTDEPLSGVTLSIEGTDLFTASDTNGYFTFDNVPVGPIHLFADGSTVTKEGEWPDLAYDLVTVAGIDNALPMPIHLLPLNEDCPIAGGEEKVDVTLEEMPGFKLEILPNSVHFGDGRKTGKVSVTQVRSDKIPMAPGEGMQPAFIITIQPHDVHFDPPAPVTYPNTENLAPGQVTEFYSFDHDLGSFVSIGTGTVSEDGTTVTSDPGFGVIKGGWHCGGASQEEGDGEPASCRITGNRNPMTIIDQPIGFSATGSPTPGQMEWSISGGNPATAFGLSTTSKWAEDGVYTVTATWTCESGQTASDSVQVIVGEAELVSISLPGCVNTNEAIDRNEIIIVTEPPGHEDAVQFDNLAFTVPDTVSESIETVTGSLGETMQADTIRVVNPSGGPMVGGGVDIAAFLNILNSTAETVAVLADGALGCTLEGFQASGGLSVNEGQKCCDGNTQPTNTLMGSVGVNLGRHECPILGIRRFGVEFGIFFGILAGGNLNASGGRDPCTDMLDWSIGGSVRLGITLAARIQLASPDLLSLSGQAASFSFLSVNCSNGEGNLEWGIQPLTITVDLVFAGFVNVSVERQVIPSFSINTTFSCPDPFAG